jgi:hypothetical protein
MDKFELMAQRQVMKDIDRELGRLHEMLLYSTNEGDEIKLEVLSQKNKLQDRLIELSK